MGYSLPLSFVKVSKKRTDNRQFDTAICTTRIVAIMSTEIYQARKTIATEKKAGTLINAAGVTKAKSAIFLDNGSVVSSPLSVNSLLNAIEKANEKASPNRTKGMKVYEISHEEEPEEEEDYYDEEDYDEEE